MGILSICYIFHPTGFEKQRENTSHYEHSVHDESGHIDVQDDEEEDLDKGLQPDTINDDDTQYSHASDPGGGLIP